MSMGSAYRLTKGNVKMRFNEKSFKLFRRYGADTKLKGKSHNLEV